MDLTLSQMAALVKLTLQRPREAARVVMRIPLPLQGRWIALALMAVLSALVTLLMSQTLTPVGADGLPAASLAPFFWAGISAGIMVITAALIYWIGKWFGGTGRFETALILVVWLQLIQVLVGIVQSLLVLALPFAADVFSLATLALFVWLLTSFVAEMHGFRSFGLVLLGVIATLLALAFLASLLLLLPFLNLGA